MKRLLPVLATLCLFAAGPASADPDPWAAKLKDGVLELAWEDLIPPDFTMDSLNKKYQVDDLEDDDPRAAKVMQAIQDELNNAPVVESLDGRTVKLPGFVLPLEGDGKKVSEFLLVPYFGACIHVPPPPSDQIVYVKTGPKGAAVRRMFDTVWVTGKLIVSRFSNDLGNAGYTLEADKVEPYE